MPYLRSLAVVIIGTNFEDPSTYYEQKRISVKK